MFKETAAGSMDPKAENDNDHLQDIEIEESLRSNNPFIIPRNHLVEEAIKDASYDNFEKFHKLFDLVSKPYKFDEENHKYHIPPEIINNNYKTFCGT